MVPCKLGYVELLVMSSHRAIFPQRSKDTGNAIASIISTEGVVSSSFSLS